MELNYSGTITTDMNKWNSDPYANANYHIIDNVNNLTSLVVSEITESGEKKYLFKVNLETKIKDPMAQTPENVYHLVAGTSNKLTINNGTINNFDDNITETKQGSLFASDGSGSGSGGGCLINE